MSERSLVRRCCLCYTSLQCTPTHPQHFAVTMSPTVEACDVRGQREVPIVMTSARRDQHGMEHALDALQKVRDAAQAVFDRIGERVDAERTRMEELQEKISELGDTVGEVSERKKATTVLSSFKYPGQKWKPEKVIQYDEAMYRPRTRKIRDQRVFLREEWPEDTHVNVPTRSRDPTDQYELPLFVSNSKGKRQHHGLGRMPKNLEACGSLLLFNTNENPYKEYGIFDPLQKEGKRKKEWERRKLAEAPMTFGGNDGFKKGGDAEGIGYVPRTGRAPQFFKDRPRALKLEGVVEWDESGFDDCEQCPAPSWCVDRGEGSRASRGTPGTHVTASAAGRLQRVGVPRPPLPSVQTRVAPPPIMPTGVRPPIMPAGVPPPPSVPPPSVQTGLPPPIMPTGVPPPPIMSTGVPPPPSVPPPSMPTGVPPPPIMTTGVPPPPSVPPPSMPTGVPPPPIMTTGVPPPPSVPPPSMPTGVPPPPIMTTGVPLPPSVPPPSVQTGVPPPIMPTGVPPPPSVPPPSVQTGVPPPIMPTGVPPPPSVPPPSVQTGVPPPPSMQAVPLPPVRPTRVHQDTPKEFPRVEQGSHASLMQQVIEGVTLAPVARRRQPQRVTHDEEPRLLSKLRRRRIALGGSDTSSDTSSDSSE